MNETVYEFGIEDIRYSITGQTEVKQLGHAASLSLTVNYTEKNKHGSNAIIDILPSDLGFYGTLTMATMNPQFDIDCGRKVVLDGGVIADIPIKSLIPVSIFFKSTAKVPMEEGFTKKVWLLGCTTGAIPVALNQTTDTVNEVEYAIPLNSIGIKLMTNDGTAEFEDARGQTTKIRRLTSMPTDAGYATFGDSVPVPKAKAAV